MTKYLISFPGPAMQISQEDWAAVREAARAVIGEAKDAGVYVFAGGISEAVETVMVAGDGIFPGEKYPARTTLVVSALPHPDFLLESNVRRCWNGGVRHDH